jgi:hypothetical protein
MFIVPAGSGCPLPLVVPQRCLGDLGGGGGASLALLPTTPLHRPRETRLGLLGFYYLVVAP